MDAGIPMESHTVIGRAFLGLLEATKLTYDAF